MDEKPNDSWIIPSECQLICHKYAWANTARWIMFVGTHDTEKPRACVNRLARKCTPSWIKGIILGQGRSVQVKSWTSLEASQDQRCTFAWLLCIFMKETHVWQEHEQISHFMSRITPILYAHLVLEPVFHLAQNVLSYFEDWQLSPPWIYWNVHERWQPRQWIISLVAVANFQPIRLWRNQANFNISFFPTNKTTVFRLVRRMRGAFKHCNTSLEGARWRGGAVSCSGE